MNLFPFIWKFEKQDSIQCTLVRDCHVLMLKKRINGQHGVEIFNHYHQQQKMPKSILKN